jgi:hypothetical protein
LRLASCQFSSALRFASLYALRFAFSFSYALRFASSYALRSSSRCMSALRLRSPSSMYGVNPARHKRACASGVLSRRPCGLSGEEIGGGSWMYCSCNGDRRWLCSAFSVRLVFFLCLGSSGGMNGVLPPRYLRHCSSGVLSSRVGLPCSLSGEEIVVLRARCSGWMNGVHPAKSLRASASGVLSRRVGLRGPCGEEIGVLRLGCWMCGTSCRTCVIFDGSWMYPAYTGGWRLLR